MIIGVGRVGTWIHRVQDFIYAEADETPYQVQQAKIAIAKGGVFGKGPGNSEAKNFLPHPYSDMIYAIILEEYGLVGGAMIIFIYLVFLLRCIMVFRRCPFAFGAFLGTGPKFYFGDTGHGKYGCCGKSCAGNRCNISAGKYGRKLIFIYLCIHRYHIKCCPQRRATGR